MTELNVGGVPEHFNYPWHYAMENGLFEQADLHVKWKSYPGGTGQMTSALREGSCDVCMVLTEGAITDIVNGNPSRIISGYVQTPLIWGIHTSPDTNIDPDEIFNHKIAISRYGSGSHLMPIVHSLIEGEKLDDDQFVVVRDLEGAISSLSSHESSIFYWEKYTTKPFVDKGVFRRIDEFVTPWPCFVIMASDEIIRTAPEALDQMLDIIHESCNLFMQMDDAPQIINERYGIRSRDAEHWFHATEWFTNSWVSDKMLKSVTYTLTQAGIINAPAPELEFVWKR
jgi:sulfonate transport system substrate-binding protein